MMDVYTQIAQAARVNRDDVKKVLYAAAYSKSIAHSIELEDPMSVSYMAIELLAPGTIEFSGCLSNGETFGPTPMSVHSLIELLAAESTKRPL